MKADCNTLKKVKDEIRTGIKSLVTGTWDAHDYGLLERGSESAILGVCPPAFGITTLYHKFF